MSSLNTFCGSGRLVSNAIALNTQKGGARFRIAIDGYTKDEVLFLDCVRFGDVGNTFQYLTKGTLVAVVGRLSESKYTNKQGLEVKSIGVIVNNIQLLGTNPINNLGTSSSNYQNNQNNNDNYDFDRDPFEGHPVSDYGRGPEAFDDTGIPF